MPVQTASKPSVRNGEQIDWARSSTAGEYVPMDHAIDLDQAAAEIITRLPAWAARGLGPGPLTWRDGNAPSPQPLEADRALVTDPDSIGVRILGADGWTELQIVLYRGGWADLDELIDDEVTTECLQIATPQEFGALLDSATTRFLGTDQPTIL